MTFAEYASKLKNEPETQRLVQKNLKYCRQHIALIRAQDAADAIGVSRQMISTIENGLWSKVSMMYVYSLATVYGVPFEEFFKVHEENESRSLRINRWNKEDP